MSARWSERQDGRDVGRADSVGSTPATPASGRAVALPVVPLVVAIAYVGVHALVWWLGTVVLP